ncbi:MAG TPA: hypothetical protein VF554_10140 [Thermoanaerobaculia bacterium]
MLCGLRAFSFVIAGLVLAAPAGGPPDRVSAGIWGGQGIGMEVTGKGATLEYDCAHGTVDEVMLLDSAGHFEVRGTHVREHPGPVHEGETNGRPALYSGKVNGDTLTLTVRLAGTDETVGTFTLVLGKPARIRRCG